MDFSPKLRNRESEISERNLSMEKRENPLILKTDAATNFVTLGSILAPQSGIGGIYFKAGGQRGVNLGY
jgi:hypothetical protein